MTKNYLLAIDLGTSGCKITVFDFKGSPMSSWIGGYETYYPGTGFVEQDPAKWWEAICQGNHSMQRRNKPGRDRGYRGGWHQLGLHSHR